MPFSDPTSVYLDALARKRAQAETLMQNSKEAGAGIVGGLEAAEGLRVKKVAEDRQTAQDAAAAAQQATESERAAEGLRLRQRTEERAAAAAAAEEGRAAELHKLTVREKAAKSDEAARAQAQKSAVETYLSIQNEGADHDTAMAHAAGMSGLTEAEINRLVTEDTRRKVLESEARGLEASKTEAEIAKLQRVPTGRPAPSPRANAPDGAPDTRTRSRTRSIGAASEILNEIEKAAEKFEAATEGPAVGRIVGKARQALTGYVPGLNESERTAFLGNAEALNAMLFPILGREDAPTETEVKRLEPLMFSGKETPDELKSKIATIRRLLEIQTSMLPAKADAGPAGAQPIDPARKATAKAKADSVFGG